MRRGFWDSFYRGWEQGDKIDTRNQGLRLQAGLRQASTEDQVDESQYNPEDFTDNAEKQGGVWSESDQAYRLPDGSLQAPTNTPTWDESTKSYQGSQGQRLSATPKFRLGDSVQSQRFSPEQVQEFRTNKMADVYSQYGEPEKAMGLRANAQNLKLGKVQLDQAELMATEAKNVRKLMKIQGDYISGALTPEEAIQQVIPIADKANGDGITFSYKPAGEGKFEITELRNDRVVGSKIVDPVTVIKEALKYSSPTLFAQMQQQDNWQKSFDRDGTQFDTTIGLKRDEYKLAQQRFEEDKKQFQQGMDWKTAQHNDNIGLQRDELDSLNNFRVNSLNVRETLGAGKNKVFVGTTADGKNAIYNTPEGLTTGPLPEGVTKDDLFPKATGLRPERDLSVTDRLKLNDAVRAELELDPNYEKIIKDPAARAVREQQIRNQLLGVDDPTSAPVDYLGLADKLEQAPQGAGVAAPKEQGMTNTGPGDVLSTRGGLMYEIPSTPRMKGGLITLQKAKELGYIN